MLLVLTVTKGDLDKGRKECDITKTKRMDLPAFNQWILGKAPIGKKTYSQIVASIESGRKYSRCVHTAAMCSDLRPHGRRGCSRVRGRSRERAAGKCTAAACRDIDHCSIFCQQPQLNNLLASFVPRSVWQSKLRARRKQTTMEH
jgi:hypothetical protein